MLLMKAACHCTAVRLEAEKPSWVADCNCTLCRRYGGMWAYYEPGQVNLVSGADQIEAYLWGDKEIAFCRCKECGCITHYAVAGSDPLFIRGVNARMMPALDPASVRVVQLDNSHTGWFWTKSESAPVASKHPVMERPGPEDWR